MDWMLHDHQHRAVIAPFASRQEAERWRDQHGLGAIFSVSPGAVRPAAGALSRPERRGQRHTMTRERHRSPGC